MSSQQDRTGIAGTDQDFVDAQPASSSPEIAVPESPELGGEPDRTENHSDIGENIAEVSPVLPEPSSLMKPDYDEMCTICRESSNRTSMREAVPCGHRFHEECILLWVEGMDHSKGRCPYCTRAVWALVNDDLNEKQYTIKPTLIPWKASESQDVGDNDLDPHIRELEQYRALETRRIKALPPTSSKHSATYLDIRIREDPWLIRVWRTIELSMWQEETHSETKVTRELSLEYLDMRKHVQKPNGELTINTDTESKQEYEKAKKEVTGAAEKYIRLGQGIDWASLRLCDLYVCGGERGITSNIWPEVDIFVSPERPNTRPEEIIDSKEKPSARIRLVTCLQEGCVALPDGQPPYGDLHPSERVTELTRQTYEWLRATMEWFFKKRGEKFQGRPFDRGTTNVLEPCKPGGKCVLQRRTSYWCLSITLGLGKVVEFVEAHTCYSAGRADP